MQAYPQYRIMSFFGPSQKSELVQRTGRLHGEAPEGGKNVDDRLLSGGETLGEKTESRSQNSHKAVTIAPLPV